MGFDITSFLMGKAAGGGGGNLPSLPEEYQEVEYLETAGATWSHVAWPVTTAPYLDVEFSLAADAPASGDLAFVGNGNINSTSNWELYCDGTQAKSYGTVSATTISSLVKGQRYKIQARFSQVFRHVTAEAGHLYVGAYSSTKFPFYGRIYSIVNYVTRGDIDATGDLRWDVIAFVPCKRKSDSVAGWYDLVGGEFYPSATETPWIAGPNV